MLIVLGGLPGVGKTSIAHAYAKAVSAVHVQVDSIEQAIRASGVAVVSVDDAGYLAAYAVAEDNLRVGHVVIADSVNPLPITRAAWREVARRAGVPVIEVEVVCSDRAEHRRRVDARLTAGVASGPTWEDVVGRDYRPWPGVTRVIDTAAASLEAAVAELRAASIRA